MPPRPRTDTIRFLIHDGLGRLLAATRESVRDRAPLLLACRHGPRPSEVGLLRAEDLDLRPLRPTAHRLKGIHSGPHACKPDEDPPADFDARRGEHYAVLGLPRDAGAFIAGPQGEMRDALAPRPGPATRSRCPRQPQGRRLDACPAAAMASRGTGWITREAAVGPP